MVLAATSIGKKELIKTFPKFSLRNCIKMYVNKNARKEKLLFHNVGRILIPN